VPRVTARTEARPFEQGRFEDLPLRPRIAHRYFEADTSDVVVDSQPFGRIRVHVASYGPTDATPLLLLHGLMTTSYSWRYMLERLGDRYRLIVPDLPGCGRSEPVPDRRCSAAALAAFVGELQQTLGIAGCQAVGNSLGGYVCLRRALDDPASFARLAVVHPPVVVMPRTVALHVGMRVPGVAPLLAHVVRRDPLRWAHKNVHYYDETLKSLEEAREYGDPLASAAGAGSFMRYLRDSLDPREQRRLVGELARRRDAGVGFPIPLMAVYAQQDPTVPPVNGPKLHALVPDSEYHCLERTSHFVHVDSPDRLDALLRGFLDG
jgi:pimeloyl-ACP methyl ester carboxylesterase